MRNIITINSILDAYTCLSSTSEDENTIFFKCIVGEVISPKLKILLDGVQVANMPLNVNQSNLINVTEYIPPTAGVLSVHYSDYDNEGTTYSIEFDNDRTGDLKLCEVDETSFNAKYYSRTPSTGGTVSVEVNSTTTGEVGSQAQVTNSGDDVNVKLDFVIPRGADGQDGKDAVITEEQIAQITANAKSYTDTAISNLGGLKGYVVEVGASSTCILSNSTSAYRIYIKSRALVILQIGTVVNVYSVYNTGSTFNVAPVVVNQSSSHGTLHVNSSKQLYINNSNTGSAVRATVLYI